VQSVDGRLFLSPSDLSAFLACPHLTTLSLQVEREEQVRPFVRHAIQALVAEKGDKHEQAYLEQLREERREFVEIPTERGFAEAERLTEESMRAGVEIVYQATFASDDWRGRADFVIRVDEPSQLGPFSYEAWDTKLARSAKPAAVLQLVYYSQEIGRIQGRLPERLHIVPGTGITESFRPGDFDSFFRLAQGRLQEHLARPETYPWPCEHCSRCDFIPVCAQQWKDDDHLTRVASIRRDQVTKLNAAGVDTLTGLAESPADLAVARLPPPMLERLRDQASLQLVRERTGELQRHLLEPEQRRGLGLLPEPSAGDMFFDMEGDPFFEAAGGLEFLFGVLCREPNGSTTYRGFRARDRESEGQAFESFVDLVLERRSEYPDLHVYHYASYEPSTLARLMGEHATREEQVDELLRGEVLVDLYQVVRQGLRAGVRSYSLKEIEQFFFTRQAKIKSGDNAVISFENYLADGDESRLTDIEAYNEEDCRATLELRDWLLAQRDDAEREFGVEIPFQLEPETKEPSEDETELTETEKLRDALLDRAQEGDERWLLAQLLGYHRREARPGWWWYFRRREMTDEELVEDSEAIGCLVHDGAQPEPVKQSLEYRFTFPVQQHHFDPRDGAEDPNPDGTAWTITELDSVAGTVTLRRGKRFRDKRLPTSIVSGGPYATPEQRAALRRLATSVITADGRWPALRRILQRELPLGGATVQRSDLDEQRQLALSLDGTYLYVQGPPGSGKTYRGARLIVSLLRAGKRIGVAAQSHKVIEHLLDAIEQAADEEGVAFTGYKRGGDPYQGDFIEPGPGPIEAYHDPQIGLIAGTSWLFAREELDESLDVLVIDEAGQISLADTLAMGTSARSLILLGDPLQLAQVTQGVHPPGSGASVLEHLLADHDTIPPDRGIFLEHSRRMHPAVCAFISDAFYEGRLSSIPESEQRVTSLGTGIRWLPAEHESNRSDSPEEADTIAAEIDRLLSATFTDANGERQLRESDVMVVAPFNAQVRLLRERLPADVEVGTVDKFQGREAAAVFYSMASSSSEDVPHGLEFLFSRNRLNVAISRAQCLAYLVCSPQLLEVNCRTIEHMRLANALCRFIEVAQVRP
jgi:uncharacterized protein